MTRGAGTTSTVIKETDIISAENNETMISP
jgi:hypothetical protein